MVDFMNLLENCSFPQNPMVRVISYACFCQKSYSSIERLTNLIYKRMMLPESSSIRFTKKVFTISTFFFLSYELAPFILGLHDTSSYTNLLTTLIPLLFTIEKISFPFFYKKTQFEVQIPSFPIQYSGSEDSLIFPIKVDTKPDIFSNLSIEEKVGQLLMVHFNGTMITDDAKILIQNTKVGGIIYYNWSNELSSPQQIQNLSSELQKLTQDNPNPISLLIATDQECGTVSRLNNGFTIFPGNSALGMTENPYFAEKMAIAIGKEMQDVGINMNLAPVVDVSSNRENRIIGIRSFGDKPKKVSRFAKSSLIGYKKVGIIPTLKHFPGHGDVDCDSHVNLPTLNKSMEELEGIELLPFRQLAQTADVIMTAHLLVPALDEKNCSTLSKKSITFLRENIGFNGVIITDSLVMKGVLKECKTVDAAAIQALNAGCDIQPNL